jgi:hypothetical protein
MAQQPIPAAVSSFFANQAPLQRERLEQIRTLIHRLHPDVVLFCHKPD